MLTYRVRLPIKLWDSITIEPIKIQCMNDRTNNCYVS